jgi:ABC-type transporter Mla subunit MlaD
MITLTNALDSISELAHEFAEPSIKPVLEDLDETEREFVVASVETLFNEATPTLPRSLNAIHDLLSGNDVDDEEKVRQAVAFFKRTAKTLQKAADAVEKEMHAKFECDSCACENGDCCEDATDDINDVVKESAYQTAHAQLMALVYIAKDALLDRKEDCVDDHEHGHGHGHGH